MKGYIKSNTAAVTLVELVVAISLVGFVVVAAITYNLIGEKFYQSTSKQAIVLNDAQYLIEQMGKDIKQATGVNFVNNDVVITSNFGPDVAYTYDQGAEKIYRDDELFASNVVEFDVAWESIDSVTVKIRLMIDETDTTKLKEESYYVTTFFLRNKE
ncbi:MAG: hypothetical protein P9M06_01875 [Candidatus Saelkia tenebricola]|nr:hypothetical protein [Candidatus Saelkia tenebricola]